MTLSVITVCHLIVQFSMEKQYSKHICQIKIFLAKKIDLFLSNLKEKTPEKLQAFQQQHR